MEYIRNPKSIKALAQELIKICNAYWTGKESEAVLKDYINYVAHHNKLLEANGHRINRSICQIIGRHRQELINRMLENYQLHL